MTVTVVLDINGVLADVRKKSESVPDGIGHDLVIPSGQRVYMRPHLLELCNYLYNITLHDPKVKVVMWTSRKKINAEPIEEFLASKFGLKPSVYLHGDDCKQFSGFHPVKDAHILRRNMGCEVGHVVFVDDAPERIKLDHGSEAIRVKSFDATKPDNGELVKVICAIAHVLEKYKQ